MEPEPANSARFKSAKPSWGQKRVWEAARGVRAQRAAQGLTWGGGRQIPWARPTAQTECCIMAPKDRGWSGAHNSEAYKVPFVPHPSVHWGSA